MLTKQQIVERREYLGGSDAAAVLGLSRWKTPLQVWCEKTGTIPVQVEENLAMEVGTELEELVCKLFTRRSGKGVRRVNETIYHPKYDFLAANIDRRIVGEDACLEAKTCSAWRAKEFEDDELPQEIIIQGVHYLAVTGKSKIYVAVLIGGNQDFRWKQIDRDEKLIADVIKKEVDFWQNYVVPKIMPKMIMSQDSDTLFRIFPKGKEQTIGLGDEADKLIDAIKSLEADYRSLENYIEKERNNLKALLGENAKAETGKYLVTWKNESKMRFDTARFKTEKPKIFVKYAKPNEIRVLRIREKKEEKDV